MVTFQGSNDNTNWVNVSLPTNSNSYNDQTTVSLAGSINAGPLNFRYFRLAVTGVTAGTVSGTIEYFSQPGTPSVIRVANSNTGSIGVTANASTNLIGGVFLSPSTSSGGLTSFQNTAVGTTAQTVKSSAGRLHRITIQNPNTSIAWLQIFNATAPTVGTTAPLMSIPVPASGIFEDFYPISDTFSTAITIAATTTPTGSTANTTPLFVSLGFI